MKTSIAILAAFFSGVTSLALGDTFGSGANTFNIDFVTIGNPGNSADTTGVPNPAGSVDQLYRMGKYEISRAMIEKASAAGGLGLSLDPMLFVPGGPRPAMPATGVTWFEAARFVNWLNTSSGSSPAYKFSTQPEAGRLRLRTPSIKLWVWAMEATTRTISIETAWRGFFCPALMSGTRRRTTILTPTEVRCYYDYPTGSNARAHGSGQRRRSGNGSLFSASQARLPMHTRRGPSPYGTMGQGGQCLRVGRDRL